MYRWKLFERATELLLITSMGEGDVITFMNFEMQPNVT